MAKRILIVEGGLPVVPFEQSLLLRKEHELIRASSGKEALEQVEAHSPSLIILDDQLADTDVLSLVDALRLLPQAKTASILLLAAMERPQVEGVNYTLTKPIVGQDFNDACRRLLSVEARAEARLLVYVNVQGFAQNNVFLCNSLNLSASGILILTTRKMRLGEAVQLQITLPRVKDKIKVTGLVVRDATEVNSRLNAYGLAFQDLSEEEQERIRAYVDEGHARSKGVSR